MGSSEHDCTSARVVTQPQPTLVMVKKEHMKPRDAFGRGAHLIKEEKPVIMNKMASLHPPPPPSSPSLAAQEQQLAIIRDQEVTLLFQALVKQGNPDPLALSLAQEMAQDRYK